MATSATGTKFKFGESTLLGLNSIGGLDVSSDTLEVTTLDDNWRKFISGLKDGGEVPISGFFSALENAGQIGLYSALETGVVTPCSIIFPVGIGASWTFDAIVTGFSTNAEAEDTVGFESTLKITGKPSLQLTLSSGLTGLSLNGVGGTFSPTFNKDVLSYTFNGLTMASCTVTVNFTNHDVKLYVNGALDSTLVNGGAGKSIGIGTVGTTTLTIVATETNKAPKTYEIKVTRVS
jgi:hypothetical protein